MKILAFAGSNSSTSINKKLVTYAASFFENHIVEILDLNDFEMPLFNVDKMAATGIPREACEFAGKIDQSDLLLISLAENNGAYTTAFKNIYDWVSVIEGRTALGGKPVFVMATSPGVRGGASVLGLAQSTFPFYGGSVVETFSLPSFYENFDDVNGILGNEHLADLKVRIDTVRQFFQ
jgi:chromate reductase